MHSRLVLIILLATVANAKTLVVRQSSIQEAIRSAAAGDTIRVEGGLYRGNLVLDKPIALDGLGKPVIRGDGRGSVLTIVAAGCTVRGFIIEHSGGMLVDEDSGILLRSNGNRIEQNELRDILFGIYFFHSSNNTVIGNLIRGRSDLGLGERGSGIHIWNSGHNTIAGNSISQVRDGMYLQNAHHSTIRGNRAFDLRYGLHYMFSDDNQFEDNLFYDNVAGAAIMYSKRIVFRRNAFIHNRGFSSFGILFQDSDDCLAEHNLIVNNVVGVFLEALRASVFRNNLVAANDLAIQIFSSASGNTFQRNNFVDNLSPIEVIGKRTGTHWSRQGVGNYWSDYEGYDLDGDGVGDVPFKIQNLFEHLEGNYPRLRLYLFSPASQALALAEKAFPVFQGSQDFDEYPLMKPAPLPVRMPELGRKPAAGGNWLVLPLGMLAFSVLMMAKERKP